MRIVSLACSNTEIVAALGCADLLVGVDDHSDFPRSALRGLPRVGPDLEIDVGRVASLEPDLVLASLTVPGHETVVEGVEAAGLPVLTIGPEGLGDVAPSVEAVANAIGVPDRGRVLAGRLRNAFGGAQGDDTAADRTPADDSPSVLIQWWPKPVIAPGARSWVHGLIELAGARNTLAHEDRLSRPLEDDEVAALAPDVIVLSWCGIEPPRYRPDVVYRNPAFADVPAVRSGQVHRIPESWLGRPGPRLLDGLAALRRAVAGTRIQN